jgi:hypothetical protein
MRKIISLFQRNYDGDRLVRNEVVPGAEWVIAGEGVATRKYDGTCCMVRYGRLFKRFEVKPNGKPPENFEPANSVDENTGKQQGWVPVGDGPEDRWHREGREGTEGYLATLAFDEVPPQYDKGVGDWIGKCVFMGSLIDGTYELVGPKIQGNPEGLNAHYMLRHGAVEIEAPRNFDGLRDYLSVNDIEGIVWHHPDGRMVKIKARGFNVGRGAKNR